MNERRRRGRWSHSAVTLAASIEGEISAAGWPVDEVLGSQDELLERYGVSRGVFREAVRLLEHYSIARMRSGRHGGLVVQEPDTGAVARGAALMLRRRGVTPDNLMLARRHIERACVAVATERIDEEGIWRLHDCLENERAMTGGGVRAQAPAFHLLIAELTQEPVLRLINEMLIQLTRRSMEVRRDLDLAASEVQKAHTAIAVAVADGNVELACESMVKHVDAMAATWVGSRVFDAAPKSPFDGCASH